MNTHKHTHTYTHARTHTRTHAHTHTHTHTHAHTSIDYVSYLCVHVIDNLTSPLFIEMPLPNHANEQ
jgi:glutamate/tyrosine decarboxylase-like PLP-dependent enzyme